MSFFLTSMLLLQAAISKILLLLITVLFISLTASAGTLADGLYAKMQTSKGEIVLRLFYKRAPLTVSNFVGLAEGSKEWKDPVNGKARKTRYYDGLSFHRVIKDFMIQGGDPLGTGTGGPGLHFRMSFIRSSSTARPEFFPWPMQEQTQTAASSLSHMFQPRTWTTSILFLEKLLKA